MKTFALLIAFSMVPSMAFGTVPTEAELTQSVRAMKMPSLERRLKARAAAFRMAAATAKLMGFGERSLSEIKRRQFGALPVNK